MIETTLQDSNFEILEHIPAADIAALEHALDEDAVAKGIPPYKSKPIGIFQRDPAKKIIAGCVGNFTWDWLYVDLLWVDVRHQRQGLGKRLMSEAESIAKQRDCTGVWVWTEDFQAPDFYQKQGYEIFCQFPDFPKGHQRIGLRKIFSAAKMREWPDDIGLSGTSRTMKGTDGYV